MHQRLFHYALCVYAFGFIAALTLGIDSETFRTSKVAETVNKERPAQAISSPCVAAPDMHVVSSATAEIDAAKTGPTPCVAPAVASPVVSPKAPLPAVVPVLPQDL